MDTSPDAAGSPSKGRPSDLSHKTWRASWWDFYPMLERPSRPIQWSQSSVIFTAHLTQPMIIGRHFSSSKQFILQSPTPVLASPLSYEPPSLISVSPTDDWLFAYFPRRDGEGIGCLWKRGAQIDSWLVNDYWAFPKAGGAVTASWLSNAREWAATSTGLPTRLPSRGPPMPVSNPTLILVTQDLNIQINYYRYALPGLRTLKRSLTVPGLTYEMVPTAMDALENVNGTRQCVDAAIGVGYNDASIFIATRSRRTPAASSPTPTVAPTPFNSMDLSIPIDLTMPRPPDQKQPDWESWGEERNVEIFDIHLRFDGIALGLAVLPLSTLDIGDASLTSLMFSFAPPTLPPTLPPGEPNTRKPVEKGAMYFVMTSIDFHEYSLPPTSSMTLYTFVSKATPGSRGTIWSLNCEASRTIENGVIAHAEAFVDLSSPSYALLHTLILNTSGSMASTKGHAKELPIGSLQVWNLPDLSDNPNFQTNAVNYPSESVGRDLPSFAAISPNRTLLCTLSSSLSRSQTTVHSLPRTIASASASPTPVASALATAILGRKSTEDIIHCISSPKVPLSEARDIMYQALHLLEKAKSDLPYASTWDIMGVAVEVYRSRGRFTKDEEDVKMLKDRSHTAHDICSVAACNIAFDDCKEDNGYELEAVWQMIGMCTWIVDFTERLMKACVLSSNSSDVKQENPQEDSSASSILDASILLHLAHPFTLQNLIVALHHTKSIRSYLVSLPAGGENPKMAQTVLVDTVDCSGIDFGGLISLLEESLPAVKSLDAQECQRALVACQPVPLMQPHLSSVVRKITESQTILNKSTLFIKPFDLADGVARLSLDSRKNNGNDVITKGLLQMPGSRDQCLRCGGRTSGSKNVTRVQGLQAPRWVMWERMWQVRCICGGPWLSAMVH